MIQPCVCDREGFAPKGEVIGALDNLLERAAHLRVEIARPKASPEATKWDPSTTPARTHVVNEVSVKVQEKRGRFGALDPQDQRQGEGAV